MSDLLLRSPVLPEDGDGDPGVLPSRTPVVSCGMGWSLQESVCPVYSYSHFVLLFTYEKSISLKDRKENNLHHYGT